MSKINDIMRKAEFIQNGCQTVSNEDYLSDYRMGKMCYAMRDYDGAEYWWEKAAGQHCKEAKDALLRLYDNELRHKYSYSIGPIPISACRRTCSGNAPHYRWNQTITSGRNNKRAPYYYQTNPNITIK